MRLVRYQKIFRNRKLILFQPFAFRSGFSVASELPDVRLPMMSRSASHEVSRLVEVPTPRKELPELSEEEIEKKTKSLVEEYLQINDIKVIELIHKIKVRKSLMLMYTSFHCYFYLYFCESSTIYSSVDLYFYDSSTLYSSVDLFFYDSSTLYSSVDLYFDDLCTLYFHLLTYHIFL